MNTILLASLIAAMNLVYDPARPEICNGDVITPSVNGRTACRPATAETSVALLIYGGGWTSMDKKDVEGIAEFLANDLGITVYNINYRLASAQNPWPACGEDCLMAGEFIFSDEFAAKTGAKPKSILVIGGSAGGHLALWTGLKLGAKCDHIISISGIADPAPDRAAHPDRYRALFGGREPTAAELDSMNVMKLVRKDGPKILLTHEYQDEVVSIESARHFLWAYRNLGNDIGLCEYSRNSYEGLTGHCIWIPGSKPHRLLPKLEREITYFLTPPRVPEPKPVKCDYNIIALYYPGTEHMPEWDMVRRMFPGRRPTLGWYDEGDPENIDWQIKWAVENGIRGFCVDWYWNMGERRLEHWVQAFYRAKRRGAFKWYMMYANHNQPGTHNSADQERITRYWLDNYFKTPEYYRIDGKPVVCIWDYRRIDEDFIAEAATKGETLKPGEGIKRAFAISERMVRAEGLPGIHWQDMWRVYNYNDGYAKARVREGYESAIGYGFVWGIHNLARAAMKPGDRNNFFDYDVVKAAVPTTWESMCRQKTLPYAIPLPTGWDDRVRSFQNALFIYDRTPEKFAAICRSARECCDRMDNRSVIIHPLNEWQEGSYIEPCDEYGFKMYEAIRDAFCEKPAEGWPKNLTPEVAGCELHEFPEPVKSAKQSWDFNSSTEGWYRQPYGGGEVAWYKDGLLTYVINRTQYYNIRQCVQPFEAARYTAFAVKMKITPNARYGLAGAKDFLCRLKWGNDERPIVSANYEVDEINSATVKINPDGEWHEYRIPLDAEKGWRGKIDELWFKAADIKHARVAIDRMRFE